MGVMSLGLLPVLLVKNSPLWITVRPPTRFHALILDFNSHRLRWFSSHLRHTDYPLVRVSPRTDFHSYSLSLLVLFLDLPVRCNMSLCHQIQLCPLQNLHSSLLLNVVNVESFTDPRNSSMENRIHFPQTSPPPRNPSVLSLAALLAGVRDLPPILLLYLLEPTLPVPLISPALPRLPTYLLLPTTTGSTKLPIPCGWRFARSAPECALYVSPCSPLSETLSDPF